MQQVPGVGEAAFAGAVVHHDDSRGQGVYGFRRDVGGVVGGQVDVHFSYFVIGAFERQFFVPNDVAGIDEAELAVLDEDAGGLWALAGFSADGGEAGAVGIGFAFAVEVVSGGGQDGDVEAFDGDFVAGGDDFVGRTANGFFVG